MKKIILLIIIFSLSKNIYAQDQLLNFNNIVIEDKEYFGCYLNPFGRMGKTDQSEILWETGAYDSKNVMKDVSASIYRPFEDSTKFVLFFIYDNYMTEIATFTTILNNKLNEGEIVTNYSINESLSCNYNGNYYYQIITKKLLAGW